MWPKGSYGCSLAPLQGGVWGGESQVEGHISLCGRKESQLCGSQKLLLFPQLLASTWDPFAEDMPLQVSFLLLTSLV